VTDNDRIKKSAGKPLAFCMSRAINPFMASSL
jgi:hypothetical protein